MDLKHCSNQAVEKKLSSQFAEFVNLSDADLEEVTILEFGGAIGGVHGSQAAPACAGCGCVHCGCVHCGCVHCGCVHCGCGGCGGCGCGGCAA